MTALVEKALRGLGLADDEIAKLIAAAEMRFDQVLLTAPSSQQCSSQHPPHSTLLTAPLSEWRPLRHEEFRRGP